MKAAVIFDNFGPYHLARLRASASVCDLLAIQVRARSAEYAWSSSGALDESEGKGGGQKAEGGDEFQLSAFQSVTLQEGGGGPEFSRSELEMRLNRALSDFQPDVVFVPGWSSQVAFAALRWCGCRGVPAVSMSESTAWDEQRSVWKEWIKRRVVGLCSAALVGGSPHADYLVALGMPRDHVFRGYDAVDNGYFAAGAAEARSQKSEVRRRFGLPDRYFLASARFVEKKNLPGLIEAYAKYRVLAQEHQTSTPHPDLLPHELVASPHPSPGLRPPSPAPASEGQGRRGEGMGSAHTSSQSLNFQLSTAPWSLVLLGDGPLRSELESLVSDLCLQSSVSMPGFKQYPDLPAYYGLADAFIHASTTEQWGLVVNEAMASGLPVLVSHRCGCARDLVRDELNGFTFDPQDPEALAQLMLHVSAFEPSRLSALSDAGRQIVSHWGPERFAGGLKQAAECALKMGHKRAGFFDRLMLNSLMRR